MIGGFINKLSDHLISFYLKLAELKFNNNTHSQIMNLATKTLAIVNIII